MARLGRTVRAMVSRIARRRSPDSGRRPPPAGAATSTSDAATAVPPAVAHTLAADAGDLPASSASESSPELGRVTVLFGESARILSPTGAPTGPVVYSGKVERLY